MELHAVREGEDLPVNSVSIPGVYQLETGEAIKLYRVDNDITRLNAELAQLTDACNDLAAGLKIENEEEEERQTKELIKKLHRYNEYKDLAQELIGKLANMEGCTTKELYPRFDLELDD